VLNAAPRSRLSASRSASPQIGRRRLTMPRAAGSQQTTTKSAAGHRWRTAAMAAWALCQRGRTGLARVPHTNPLPATVDGHVPAHRRCSSGRMSFHSSLLSTPSPASPRWPDGGWSSTSVTTRAPRSLSISRDSRPPAQGRRRPGQVRARLCYDSSRHGRTPRSLHLPGPVLPDRPDRRERPGRCSVDTGPGGRLPGRRPRARLR
jgi:hypothetical protein